nr:nucleosome assembly protein 1,4 [Tanacetum cinerariifolium]
MLMGYKKLDRLDMGLCPGALTDVGLGFIGEYGLTMRHLSLCNTGVSDVGLLELLKGCPKLRKLKLKQSRLSFYFHELATNVLQTIPAQVKKYLLDGSPSATFTEEDSSKVFTPLQYRLTYHALCLVIIASSR